MSTAPFGAAGFGIPSFDPSQWFAAFAPQSSAYRGYAGYDAFYTARGHYSAIRTCNAWTGDALRYAGVRIGRWTPFPVTVMRWFD